MREKAGNGEAVDDDEEDEEDDDDDMIEEELTYISPIETVDPYITFKRALTSTSRPSFSCSSDTECLLRDVALQHQNAAAYQAATTALDVDQQTLLMEVMRLAEANEASASA